MSNFNLLTTMPRQNLKIMIQGQVSAGKSWLAASAATKAKRVRFFDFDGKLEGLAKHKKAEFIIGKTYTEITARQGPVPEPRAAVEFINDIGLLEYEKKEGKYESCVNVIDSLTYLSSALDFFNLYTNPKARKELVIGPMKAYIADNYGPYQDTLANLNSILSRLFALDDLIVIAHERPEEDKTSSEKDKQKRLTGRYSIHPPRLDILKSLFNDKYRVEPRLSLGGNFSVQLETNDDFLGASTLLGVKQVETADLAELLVKDKTAREAGAKTSLALVESK